MSPARANLHHFNAEIIMTLQKLAAILALTVLAAPQALYAADEPIDMEKARALLQRERRGEKLSDDEQAYLDRAKAERAKRNNAGGQRGNLTPKESTGLVPLTDLADNYKEHSGGLYGNGRNEPPADHLNRALAAMKNIRPLDPAGKPAANGKIVLLSIGMSNTTQEFSQFKRIADKAPAKNPNLIIVDAAQGGMDAPAWIEEPRAEKVWSTVENRLNAAGVTAAQVQVIWIKQAIAQPARLGEFPQHAAALQDDLVKILNRAKERFPNLQLAYLSSRIYAGYAAGALNPEPFAYEGAFAVRGVIQQQIKGDPALNADAQKGPVKSPVVLWGPYLWADGTKGRKSDKLTWLREDFANDGTHPSDKGRDKVARLLLDFLKTSETSKPWFTK
jgi:hypothetical protein